MVSQVGVITGFGITFWGSARFSQKRAKKCGQRAGLANSRGFFVEWAKWFEEDIVEKMDLHEELLAPTFAQRTTANPFATVEEASITSRVWIAKGGGPIRRARSVIVNAGIKVQAYNVVVYPSYDRGLQPVLGIDLLSFSSHKQLLFGVDWAPMLPGDKYAEAKIAPFLSSLLDEFDHLRMTPSGKVYGENPEFFSPYMFFSRPRDKEALQPGSELWTVSSQYFDRYLRMLDLAESPVDAELLRKAKERQVAYDIWHAERDPALVLFRKMFGKEWTEDFSRSILFPGSVQTEPQGQPGTETLEATGVET